MKTSKRLLIIAIFTFYVLGFFMLFNDKVSAAEISQFCDYTDPCLTTEQIDSWINDNNIDTTVYDSYLIVSNIFSTSNHHIILFFNYQDYLDNNIYLTKYTNHTNFKLKNIYGTNYSNDIGYKVKLSNIKLHYQTNEDNYFVKGYNSDKTLTQHYYAYYTNRNLYDVDGNIVFERNNLDFIPEEPEEEPITIINKMALFVNDIVIYFNENNISFYQILIGLFIFNFLVYVICYIVRRF